MDNRQELAAAIARNVFPDSAATPNASRLAAYAMAAAASLAQVPLERIGEGVVSFPDPAAYVEAET
jgi:hypothetical protein